MSINTQELLDDKARKFGTSPDSDVYSQAFMSALRRTIVRLNNKTGMSIVSPDDPSTDIEAEEAHYDTISLGIDFYLEDTHLFTTQPLPVKMSEFKDALNESQRVYLQTQNLNRAFGTLPPSAVTVTSSEGFV